MNWRETAFIPEGARPGDTDMDSIVSAIPAAPQVRMACRVRRFKVAIGASPAVRPTFTDQSLVVAKDRMFKSPGLTGSTSSQRSSAGVADRCSVSDRHGRSSSRCTSIASCTSDRCTSLDPGKRSR